MADFAYFLGRFHVLVLHLPIAMILAAATIEWLALGERYRAIASTRPFLWGAAAISSVVTVVLGYLHLAELDLAGDDAAGAHRLYGTSVAVVSIAIAALAVRSAARFAAVRRFASAALVALLVAAGHYGGSLTHGPEFLLGPLDPSTADARGVESTAVAPSSALIARLWDAGFSARAVAESDRRLIVGVASPGRPLGAEAFEVLAEFAAEIVDLNLQNSGVGDAALEGFDRFTALRRLRLSGNRVTDAGLPSLAGLTALEHLNLYGNAEIHDSGLEPLVALPALRELYLWQTGVTDEGVAEFRERRPDVMVHNGAAAVP